MRTLRIILTVGNLKQCALSAGAVASAVVLLGASTWAADIATIQGNPSGTAGLTLDSSPVITSILSQPGTYGGHAFTGWSFLVNDGTGSIDVFTSASSLSTLAPGYTPTVGDVISLSGTYSPYHQIPEMATLTAFSRTGTGVAPGPVVQTIPTLNQGTLPFTTAGHLIELDNVTISGGGVYSTTFPTYANGNVSYTVTDSDNNSMVLYDWVTSYSTAAAMGGNAVPTGLVDIIGFDSVFTSGTTSTAEFTPLQITQVPEPSMLALAGLGLLGVLVARRRQR
jgi:hypothetical protein